MGDGLVARVVSVDAKKQQLDFTLLPDTPLPLHPAASAAATASTITPSRKKGAQPAAAGAAAGEARLVPCAAITVAAAAGGAAVSAALPVGSLVMGRVSGCAGGVRVLLGGRLHGTAAYTDIHDVWVANAVEGLGEGAYVRARVVAQPLDSAAHPAGSMGAGGGVGEAKQPLPRVCLSLRASEGGALPEAAAAAGARAVEGGAPPAPILLPPALLSLGGEGGAGGPAAAAAGAAAAAAAAAGVDGEGGGAEVEGGVRGYVKRVVARQGMFVSLDRAHDARVKMCNLSDGWVFPWEACLPALAMRALGLRSGRSLGRVCCPCLPGLPKHASKQDAAPHSHA